MIGSLLWASYTIMISMRIQKNRWIKPSKRFVLVATIVVLVVFAVSLYFIVTKRHQTIGLLNTPPSETSSVTSTTSQASDTRPSNEPQVGDPKAASPTPGTAASSAFATTKPNLYVSITNSHVDSGKLHYDVEISPASTTGSCTVELTREGYSTVSQTTDVVLESGKPTCKSRELSLGGSRSGQWTLTIKIVSGSNVATASKVVII